MVSAKSAICVHFPPRSFEIYDDIEAMLSAVEAVSFSGLNLDFVNSRTQAVCSFATDRIAAFPNGDFCIAFTVAFELDAHFPAPNALPLDNWIRR